MITPSTNSVVTARYAGALYNLALDYSTTQQILASTATPGAMTDLENQLFIRDFSNMATSDVATIVATNLGLTGDALDAAVVFLTGWITGTVFTERGAVIAQIVNNFSLMTEDPTFGTFATAWNVKVGNAIAYAQNPTSTTTIDFDLVPQPTPGTVTLTYAVDHLTGHIFEAPKGFTPGGSDQVNTLNDDDVLNGTTAADDVLNFTYVNDADTGDHDIQPTITGVETINVNFSTSIDSTLDLQDSTGVNHIHLSRIDDGQTVTIDNIAEKISNDLSINTSNAPTANVNFTYLAQALKAADDSVTLTLNNAQVQAVVVEQHAAIPSEGFETFNLVSTGAANSMTSLQAEDVQTLNIKGTQSVSIFGSAPITDTVGGAVLVEGTATVGGLLHMAGSLTKIDASGLTGNLAINLNNVLHATKDGTSGTDVAVSVIGATGDDTFWIGNGVDANDTIDGGTGGNTAILVGGTVAGNINNAQNLQVRTNAAAVTVDTSKLPQLTDITVRNEGHTVHNNSTQVSTTVTLNNVTAAIAANGINVEHGTTYNNAIGDLTLNVDLKTDGAADSVVYTITEGINSDPRFNFNITSTDFETVKIEDNDSESNTVGVGATVGTVVGVKPTTKLEVTGGVADASALDFLNLDDTVAPEAPGPLPLRGVYGYDTSDASSGTVPVISGTQDLSVITAATTKQVYTSVDNYGDGAAAAAFTTTTIDASTQVSQLVIRVGSKESQTIKLGTDNDTVVFDASVDRVGDLSTEYAHAGLTNSDTVNGGTGTDTLVVDGESGTAVTLQQSEWQNVSKMDQIYIVSNNGSSAYTNGSGFNFNYRLDITDGLINSTDGGSTLVIRNDINRSDAQANDNAEENAGRHANLLLDLTNLNDSSNTVTYDGAEGTVGTLRLVLDDASFNGLNTIDGGDTNTNTLTDKGIELGNDNVIEVQNSATVTIADLALLSNFSALEFTNTQATVQTLNLDLSDARLDTLADSNHTATALERESFAVRAYASQSADSDLVLNTTNVTGNFDLTINTTGMAPANAGIDILRLGVSTATDYTIITGGGADTIELFGTAPGFILRDTAAASYTLQYLDVLGNLTGVVSDVTGVNTLDLRNYKDAAGGAASNVLVVGSIASTFVTNDGFSIGGSAPAGTLTGADTITLGGGQQIVTLGAGANVVNVGNTGSSLALASMDTITDFTPTTYSLGLGLVAGATNYVEVADGAYGTNPSLAYADMLLAANAAAAALHAANPGVSDLVVVASDTTVGGLGTLVFEDTNGNGTVDQAIRLTGVTSNAFISEANFGGIGGDTTPPTLLTSNPADNAGGVAVGANVVLTFSENVVAGAGNVSIFRTADNTLVTAIPAGDPQVSIAGGVVTVNPAADLAANSGFYVRVDANAFRDAANNFFAGIADPTALNFTTAGGGVPGVPLPVGTTAAVVATAAAEMFTFDVAGARAIAENTLISLNGFAVANDSLQIDLVTANPAITNLSQLNGVDGIAVESNVILNNTLINFGNDTNGDLIAVTLAGIVDPATVSVSVI